MYDYYKLTPHSEHVFIFTFFIADLLDYTISNIKNTAPFNLTGHPALSINTGFSKGLPVGMQITGRMFDEQTVLKVAYAYECLRDGHN